MYASVPLKHKMQLGYRSEWISHVPGDEYKANCRVCSQQKCFSSCSAVHHTREWRDRQNDWFPGESNLIYRRICGLHTALFWSWIVIGSTFSFQCWKHKCKFCYTQSSLHELEENKTKESSSGYLQWPYCMQHGQACTRSSVANQWSVDHWWSMRTFWSSPGVLLQIKIVADVYRPKLFPTLFSVSAQLYLMPPL